VIPLVVIVAQEQAYEIWAVWNEHGPARLALVAQEHDNYKGFVPNALFVGRARWEPAHTPINLNVRELSDVDRLIEHDPKRTPLGFKHEAMRSNVEINTVAISGILPKLETLGLEPVFD
jgi:hypothetical protein